MIAARHSGAGRLARILCLFLAAAFVFLSVAPPAVATGGMEMRSAVLPCHGGSDAVTDIGGNSAATDCPAAKHHCAACLIAIVGRTAPNALGEPHIPAPALGPATSRALTPPDVPHGPPRPV